MNILFTAEYDEKEIEELYKLGNVRMEGWAKGISKLSEEELMEYSKDVDIIITSYDDITKNIIDNAKNLKLIACTRATPVNIDVKAAKERNIPVIYTPGRNSDSTAEFTIALMLGIARKVPMAYKALKDGKFTGPTPDKNQVKSGLKEDMIWDMNADSPYVIFKGTQLKNKTLGIIGYGSIGRRVGNIAKAFGMRINIYDPYVCEVDVQDPCQKKVSLEELLKESDFVSVHLKVTPQTRGFIGKKEFEMMKESAYFINCSRGAVIDEDSLIEVLRERKIAGAALDVFSKEPIFENHPFITELDNVLITPHIAGATDDILANHTKMIISDLKRFLNKEPLLYEYKC
ncbi:MAG: 2-hydroxyacid dehydrogenase [Peptostreptococcaceae bacterium]